MNLDNDTTLISGIQVLAYKYLDNFGRRVMYALRSGMTG